MHHLANLVIQKRYGSAQELSAHIEHCHMVTF